MDLQDVSGRFYLLGSAGLLYTLDGQGMSSTGSTPVDLGWFPVEYSGYGLSVPRTGTLPGDVMDVVFPSGNGSQWLYLRLDLTDAP